MGPLLTIAIPTWNRAEYLKRSLIQLHSEIGQVPPGTVEVIVSDNCSTDFTREVVSDAVASGLDITYLRNDRNLGWALNFIQCFERASGRYVLLMGDDDLVVEGCLPLLINRLEADTYGVVCVKPYGFDEDFKREHPGGSGTELVFKDPHRFLLAVNGFFTLTSACVINKSLLSNVNSAEFAETDLAVFHLVLKAALASDRNLLINRYLVASKRQNSHSYEYTDVFIDQFWQIIDAHIPSGLSVKTVQALERIRMLTYYPFYLLDMRLSGRGDLGLAQRAFENRFKGRWLFRFWLLPTLRLPRLPALVWGGGTTAIGRIIRGDLRRGLKFAWNRVVNI